MEDISKRKQHHLDICLDTALQVESGSTLIERIKLPHSALPETDYRSISLETPFIGYKLSMPLMISSMTGGSPEGLRLNRMMAKIAGERGIAIGTGSMRVMLADPQTTEHFELKALAPDVPVLGNIGAAQLLEFSPQTIAEAVKRIGADGLFVHLNAAQELFQPHGNDNSSGWYNAIRHLIDTVPFPVLVKETGQGISPVHGLRLLKAGVAFVDIAGSGGTDWVCVESLRQNDENVHSAGDFFGWGYPTGLLLLSYRELSKCSSQIAKLTEGRLIASGGLRQPLDFAISLSCGAMLAAAALPFIRAASVGYGRVNRFIDSIEKGMKTAIALTGSKNLEGFRRTTLRISPELTEQVNQLANETMNSIEDDF